MENRLKARLENRVAVFDGAMGTELYKKNFFVNTSYESLCLNNGDAVRSIHVAYRDAGAEIITTNTYGANFNKLNKFGFGDKVAEINRAGVALARKAAGPDLLVAGDIGPVGELPQGVEYDRKQKSAILQEQLAVLAAESCDFILFESFSTKDDILVMLDAIQALELEKPYMLSCKFDEKALLTDGTTAVEVFDLLKAAPIQPTAFGINCGIGPEPMLFVVEKIVSISPYPVIAQPNAGSPKTVDGRMIAMCSPEYFATYAMRYVALGVKGVGGCCGTTPEDIANLARWVHPMAKTLTQKDIFTEKTEAAPQEEFPVAQRSTFAEKLMAGKWVTNVEIVPPQGYLLEQTIEKAKICRDAGFDAINIPDGPRASSRLSTLVTAYQIQAQAGIEAILHQCCRDKNLIGMQAELLGCAQLNVNNILFITGDPPKLGAYPFASGVFDLDSIGMLKLQKRLNQGLDVAGKSIGTVTKAFMGAGADPNALDMDREIRRTREKIQAGAQFIITQPVFDVEPLLRFMDAVPELATTPLIAGIWPLASLRNAEFMKAEVPGVVVPDSIIERMGRPATKEDQRKVGIEIAREAIAAIRDRVAGVQVSAPFGNVNTAIAVAQD